MSGAWHIAAIEPEHEAAAVDAAAATTAPAGSLITPVMLPRSLWAKAMPQSTHKHTSSFMSPLLAEI